MGIWLMPEPPGYRPYMISFQREEDLEQVVDILRPLKVGMVIQNAATIRSLLLVAAINATRSQYTDKPGPLPDSILRRIMADQDIGMWNIYGALYGPPPVMDTLWTVIRDSFSKVPGAKFYFLEDRKRENDLLIGRADAMRGVPRLSEFSFINWTGGGGHIGFSPVSPIRGREAMKQYTMVRDRLHQAAAAGYGEYRTHLSFMDDIAATYGWNNHALMKLHQTIKDALDPKGILAPGKSGIWPARYRRS
jgi:4-cresol dehydrogenase (hydroxylating)